MQRDKSVELHRHMHLFRASTHKQKQQIRLVVSCGVGNSEYDRQALKKTRFRVRFNNYYIQCMDFAYNLTGCWLDSTKTARGLSELVLLLLFWT